VKLIAAIDIRTLALAASIASFIVALTLGAATSNFREKRKSTAWWAGGFLLLALGFLLLLHQGTLAPFLSVVLANTLMLASAVMLSWGVDAFEGVSPRFRMGGAVVCAGFLVFLYFTFFQPLFSVRLVAMSLLVLLVDILIITRLLGTLQKGVRLQKAVTAAFFLVQLLGMLGRAILGVSGHASGSLFVGPASFLTFFGSIVITICVALGLLSMVARKTQMERELTIKELETALGRVRTLSGLLPLCPSCKRIRDESGEWREVEQYVQDRTEANFSHGICPDCAERLYPGLLPPETPVRKK
jgi:hypothetical protein